MANEVTLIDLGAVDVILTGPDIGTLTIRGYGTNPACIQVESLDPNLYTEAVGAYGDMLINKSYKARNKKLRLNILRNQYYYKKLRNIIALELTGQSILFSVLVKDNNSKELFACPQAVMKVDPNAQWGSEPEPNVEFEILMPSVVYSAPVV
jgi:hypothetical protein